MAQRGLPASYIKKHSGDMKAAWADYKAHHGKGKSMAQNHPHSDHHPARGRPRKSTAETEVTERKSPGLRATVQFETEKRVDPEAIGALLYGMLTEAMSPTTGELQLYFPPGSTGEPTTTPVDTRTWHKGSDEREIGREMARALGFGLTQLRISPQQWAAMYPRALAAIQGQQGGIGIGVGGGLLPPLANPTAVTSPFGVSRAGRLHRGVDLQAAIGTPVVAPSMARVLDVFNEAEGGQSIRLALMRPDGGFAGDVTTDDDSGLLVTYAHLSEQLVRPGEIVAAGQVVGRSGNTGDASTGPHLHVQTEYFADAPFFSTDVNARYFVDPAGVWGGSGELIGTDVPSFPPAGAAIAGIAQDRVTSSQQPFIVNVTSGGTMQVVGQGAAVNANARVLFPLSGSGDTGDGGRMPVPDRVSQQAQQLGASSILTGIGTLAGEFFGVVQGVGGPLLRSIAPLVTTVGNAVGQVNRVLGFVAGPVTAATGAVVTIASPFLASLIPGPVGAGLGGAAAVVGPVLGGIGTLLGFAAPVAGNLAGDATTAVSSGVAGLFGGVTPPLANESPMQSTSLPINALQSGFENIFGALATPSNNNASNPTMTPGDVSGGYAGPNQ